MENADDTESGSETSRKSLKYGFDLWALHKSLQVVHSKRRMQNNYKFPQDELCFYLSCHVLHLKGNSDEALEEMKIFFLNFSKLLFLQVISLDNQVALVTMHS